MFDNAFFGVVYFGPNYFGQAGDTPIPSVSGFIYLRTTDGSNLTYGLVVG